MYRYSSSNFGGGEGQLILCRNLVGVRYIQQSVIRGENLPSTSAIAHLFFFMCVCNKTTFLTPLTEEAVAVGRILVIPNILQ